MLSEEDTRHEAVKRDAQGFSENHHAAKEGAEAAGMAREAFELRSGRKVLSPENRKNHFGLGIKQGWRLKTKNLIVRSPATTDTKRGHDNAKAEPHPWPTSRG